MRARRYGPGNVFKCGRQRVEEAGRGLSTSILVNGTNRIKLEVAGWGEGELASGLSTALSGCCQRAEEEWSK